MTVPGMSGQSCLSANYNIIIINQSKPEAVLGSPGIYLTAEETPRKLQLGDRVMKGHATSHRLKLGPFPQMRSVGSHSTSRDTVEDQE